MHLDEYVCMYFTLHKCLSDIRQETRLITAQRHLNPFTHTLTKPACENVPSRNTKKQIEFVVNKKNLFQKFQLRKQRIILCPPKNPNTFHPIQTHLLILNFL